MQQPWNTLHTPKRRPTGNDLAAYWPPEALNLFTVFAQRLHHDYGVSAQPMTHIARRGWTLRFGHAGVPLVTGVTILPDGFEVEGVQVRDNASLATAFAMVEARHRAGFDHRLAAHQAAVRTRQANATATRKAREKAEILALGDTPDPLRLNRFVWAKKVARRDLKRLYTLDAAGRPDEALADAVGTALYARCRQGQEEWALWDEGLIRCHGCGKQLPVAHGLMECGCGQQYIARDWARAFRANNMPAGSAWPIFVEYVKRWPRAHDYAAKMRAIDWLVHAFHVNLVSGVKGRMVAVNLVEGTKAQVEKLIVELAYER